MIKVTKTSLIKKHFLSGRSLTHLEALGLYGTNRLSAYVLILKKKHNMNILTERKVTLQGSPYGRYHYIPAETAKVGTDG
jgi:hypothetical protein